MAKDSSGYVGKDSSGKWFARVTFTIENGKRKNIVRKATDKQHAKQLLKNLVNELDENGKKFPKFPKSILTT